MEEKIQKIKGEYYAEIALHQKMREEIERPKSRVVVEQTADGRTRMSFPSFEEKTKQQIEWEENKERIFKTILEYWESKEYYEDRKKEISQDEYLQELYKQVNKYYTHIAADEDRLSEKIIGIGREAIETMVQLETKTAKLVFEDKISFIENLFEKCVLMRFASSIFKYIEKREIITLTSEQQYFFSLMCKDKAAEISIGFNFIDAKNILGWELVYVGIGVEETKPIEKLDWNGSQSLLAYLFMELEELKLITNKHYTKYLSNHFTVNGKSINGNSLKTAVNKAELRMKAYQDKSAQEKQVENIVIVEMPRLNDALKKLDKFLGKQADW